MTANTLEIVKTQILRSMQEIFSDSLREVVLYGSYARGDYHRESDVDIAAVVDLDRNGIEKHSDKVDLLVSTLSLQYDCWVSINCIPTNEFMEWKEALPYYRAIDLEGLRLVA